MAARRPPARRHPRERLASLRAPVPDAEVVPPEPPVAGPASEAMPPEPVAGPYADAAPAEPAAGPDAAVSRAGGSGSDGAGRAAVVDGVTGRLVRRWLPAGAAGLRFDPGRRAAALLAAVVLLAAAIAGAAVWRARPVAEPVPALAAVDVGTTTEANGGELVVSIAGLVARPGLVHLRPGARVVDAIEAAGGPVPGTDLTGVNLARRLTDGEHVVIGPAPAAAAEAAGGSGSRVDLNTATLAELDALPGVGPVTAQRILDWRAAHGRFASVDQLREVDGIGEARFSQLRDLVTA